MLARHKPVYPSSKNNKKNKKTLATQDGKGKDAPAASVSNHITYYYRYYKDAPAPLTAITSDIERFAHEPWSFGQRALASLCALVLASMVAWSRVYLGYHTPKQVFVGCLAGTLSAVGWFGITLVIRQTGLLASALDLPVARWFRLRDLVVEEDLCQAGWEKWESRKGVQARDGDDNDKVGEEGLKLTKGKSKTT